MGHKERLLQFIENERLSKAEFERSAGLSNGYVNKLKGNIGDGKLSGILTAYPILNRVWLLTGEGEMLNSSHRMSVERVEKEEYETWLLPMTAHGGSLTGVAADGVCLQGCEKIVSPIRGVDFAISVYGDSMSPEYPAGSKVLVKKINHESFIEWGNTYVLDTCNGVMLKQVFKSDNEGYVTCRSLNEKFPEFDVPLGDIGGMYRVLMCMTMK